MKRDPEGTAGGKEVRRIAIVGSGTAAWLTAAALARIARIPHLEIVVVELPSGGVDSAALQAQTSCLPSLVALHRLMGVDERAFMKATGATFRLASRFVGWRGESCDVEPLGDIGAMISSVEFQHHWLRLSGHADAEPLTSYSLAALAAYADRFTHPLADKRSALSTLEYGYHVDVRRYGEWLKTLALASSVRSVAAQQITVEQDSGTGYIRGLRADASQRIEADLFIDCSGSGAILLARAIGVRFIDWRNTFPCDTVMVVSAPAQSSQLAITELSAHACGWQSRVPLQDRTGTALFYASGLLDDGRAGEMLGAQHRCGEPKRFASGRRERFWAANVIGIGASACALEPLAGTDLHLVGLGIANLLQTFPRTCSDIERVEYNRAMAEQVERVRDFAALRYVCSRHGGSEFWERRGTPSDALAYQIDAFRHLGKIVLYEGESFSDSSWLAAMVGNGVVPMRHAALAETLDLQTCEATLRRMRSVLHAAVQKMPTHSEYLQRYLSDAPSR